MPGPQKDGPDMRTGCLPVKTPNPKVPSLSVYAMPVALLMMAGGIGVQSASAEPVGQHRTFEARFVFNPADPAEKIYADIKRTAESLCEAPGLRPLTLLRLERQCAADLVDAVVERLSRKDIADIHTHASRG